MFSICWCDWGMSLVSKPAPPPKKALSSLLPRKTAPVRKKPPPPRSASYENNRVPPPPQKKSLKNKIKDIPKPASISALLPPPPERRSRSPERERNHIIHKNFVSTVLIERRWFKPMHYWRWNPYRMEILPKNNVAKNVHLRHLTYDILRCITV